MRSYVIITAVRPKGVLPSNLLCGVIDMEGLKMSKNRLIVAVIAVVLVAGIVALVIGLAGKGKTDKKTDEIVENATASLEEIWVKVYDDIAPNFEAGPSAEEDRKIDIRGVRLITVNAVPDLYDGLSYVVEFELYSNRYRTSPYLVREDIYTTVLVYEDGRTETLLRDFFKSYADNFENEAVMELVKEIKVFDDEYDAVIDLNKK